MPIENRLADEDLVSPVPGLAEAVRQRLAKLESESVDRQWRVLASVLYSALGAPDVEGITAIRVTRLLNGKIANAQEIDDLMHAMLRQVSALHAKHTAPPVSSAAGRELQRLLSTALSPNQAELLLDAAHKLLDQDRTRFRRTERGARRAGSAKAPSTKRRRRTAPDNPPPQPDAETIAAFMGQVNLLYRWSGFSFRGLEDEANARRLALPHSTFWDALHKTDALLPFELLNALTICCGLPPAERIKWETFHRRLSGAGPATVTDESTLHGL